MPLLAPRNFKNSNSVNSSSSSNLLRKKSVFESIESDKIGEGKYFTEGKFGHKKNLGLKGQLSKLKRTGKLLTKNLSKKNLGDMYNIIANRLKKHNVGYGVHINRKDKLAIMAEAEKLVRTKSSKFSREDKADLESVVDVLKEKSKSNLLRKKQISRVAESKNSPLLRNKKSNLLSPNLNNSTKTLNTPKFKHQSGNTFNNQDNKKDKDDGSSQIAGYKPISQPVKDGELEKTELEDMVM